MPSYNVYDDISIFPCLASTDNYSTADDVPDLDKLDLYGKLQPITKASFKPSSSKPTAPEVTASGAPVVSLL